MKVYEIINKAEFLKKGMETNAKALATAMSSSSLESVVKSLLKDYQSFSRKYYDYMDSNVNTTVYLKGIINTTFEFIDVDLVGDIDDENIIQFSKGDEVEILKIIEDNSFLSGIGYVCLNTRNNESVTIDSSFIDLIK